MRLSIQRVLVPRSNKDIFKFFFYHVKLLHLRQKQGVWNAYIKQQIILIVSSRLNWNLLSKDDDTIFLTKIKNHRNTCPLVFSVDTHDEITNQLLFDIYFIYRITKNRFTISKKHLYASIYFVTLYSIKKKKNRIFNKRLIFW